MVTRGSAKESPTMITWVIIFEGLTKLVMATAVAFCTEKLKLLIAVRVLFVIVDGAVVGFASARLKTKKLLLFRPVPQYWINSPGPVTSPPVIWPLAT